MDNQTDRDADIQDEFLPIRTELIRLRNMYKDNPGTNFMLISDWGVGKTQMIGTARAPILLLIFDPGGAKTLTDEIANGRVIPIDLRGDDPDKPTRYDEYNSLINSLMRVNAFEKFGTVALDSLTEFSEVIMNKIQWKAKGGKGRDLPGSLGQGSSPQIQDYNIQISTLRAEMLRLAALPCDVVVTGHLDYDKDDLQKMYASVMVTGKAKTKCPIVFDEVYKLDGKVEGDKKVVTVLTAHKGIFKASTRIGRNGIFDIVEKPDIKYLLGKAGFPNKDKELISLDI